jgi:hypothetical protein
MRLTKIKKVLVKAEYTKGGEIILIPKVKGRATSTMVTIKKQTYWSEALSELVRLFPKTEFKWTKLEGIMLTAMTTDGLEFTVRLWHAHYDK